MDIVNPISFDGLKDVTVPEDMEQFSQASADRMALFQHNLINQLRAIDIMTEAQILALFPVTHASTTGQGTDDHHPQIHTIVSHDTGATGAELDTLTNGSNADALHEHQAAHTAATTRVIASPYAVLATDSVIFCDTDGGAILANLPAGIEGTHYKIINCGSSGNDVTVDPNGVEQLYGSGAGVASTLSDGEVINIHYNAIEGWY